MTSAEPRLALAAGGAEPPDNPPGFVQGLDMSKPEVAAFVRMALARGFVTFEEINATFRPSLVITNPIESIASFLFRNDIALDDH